MSNTAGIFHESSYYEENQLGAAVQKSSKNYWCTDIWNQKLYKNSARNTAVCTRRTKTSAKTNQELLVFGHIAPKLCKNYPRIIGVWAHGTKTVRKILQELLA